ncbi:MAG: DMT family transporter [Betaproteobacteria bacterium]|nr:DMT family transporter [Betaproteobacteria bacterium]
MTPRHERFVVTVAPGLFVLLWSTGFVGAKLGLPYAEPLTFLLTRFLIVLAVMLPVAIWMGAPWPKDLAQAGHIAVAGLLVHAGYLGGVFGAIHQGMPAGITALIAGLQPVLTALAAGPFLGEKILPRQWAGFLLGLAGVVLVVSDKVAWQAPNWQGAALGILALVSITAGTLYQKRFCGHMDVRTGGVIQFSVSALAFIPLALTLETMRIEWTPQFMFALGWLVVVLSFGAITLLMWMIRHGEAARVSSLFYLTPPTTAVLAFVGFGEKLGPLALAGMAAAAVGVAMVMRRG